MPLTLCLANTVAVATIVKGPVVLTIVAAGSSAWWSHENVIVQNTIEEPPTISVAAATNSA